jgi:hypothetical protein
MKKPDITHMGNIGLTYVNKDHAGLKGGMNLCLIYPD